jgi:hypothetical protein
MCNGFHSGCDVHTVSEEVTISDHDLAHMDANAERDAPLTGNLLVDGSNPFLHTDRTSHGVNRARKLGQDTVSGSVGDAATALGNLPIHHLAMGVEQAKCASFVRVHEARVARHVCADDCGEAAPGR